MVVIQCRVFFVVFIGIILDFVYFLYIYIFYLSYCRYIRQSQIKFFFENIQYINYLEG